ncbi:PilZ domain containing protein [Aliivibrio wodanis]|uniref:Cyclic diguanosine monophosphate-binding protein n=1 Tax=Aliivibrio wodanis TaxID=80852 RepID=A0A090IMU7_9GAMM|nr:PilZ domain containing protein [Aliivibrio wodanis]
MIERRKFSRVVYQANVALLKGNEQWNGSLMDLSLHGLLVGIDDECTLESNEQLTVDFTLNESDIHITTECSIVKRKNNTLRLCIHHIGIDSISHLKRLIELNVGNSDLLLRQLSELTEPT